VAYWLAPAMQEAMVQILHGPERFLENYIPLLSGYGSDYDCVHV